VRVTIEDVTSRIPGKPQSVEMEAVTKFVRMAKERGLGLTGPDGRLKQLTKTVIQTALNEEMTEHLGYEKHDPIGRESGNIRDKTGGKTVLTDSVGAIDIEMPRDRAGMFEPQIRKVGTLKWAPKLQQRYLLKLVMQRITYSGFQQLRSCEDYRRPSLEHRLFAYISAGGCMTISPILNNSDVWPEEGLRHALMLRDPSSVSDPVVIDIGAHHGETLCSVLAHTSDNLRYLALEPNPESFRHLERTATSMAREGLRLECIEKAAGPIKGSATFFRTQESAVSGLLRPEVGLGTRVPTGDHRVVQEFEVDVICVDDLLRERGLMGADVLKIDAEGYDLDVLKGAKESIASGRIGAILAEVFFVSYRGGQAYFWDIATFLKSHNYYFVHLYDTRQTSQGRLYTGNGLWVSESVARANDYL
jgi:FkbM family methyltransferase